VYGVKSRREHELLSDVEWNLFILLEWAPDVVDIKEQFPLDRDLTEDIALSRKIRHPSYVGTHVHTVMTVDFLVTRIREGKKVLEAFDCKRSEDAEDARSIEKLEIQRAYFDGMEIRHHLVLHSQLPMAIVKNLEWIRGAQLKPNETELYPGFLREHEMKMTVELGRSTKNRTLAEYCMQYDAREGLEPGTALRVARMLMQSRVLMPDLKNPDLPTSPLQSFVVTARPGQLRAV